MGHKYVKCNKCHELTQADFPYCNYCGAKLDNVTVESETDEENEIQITITDREPDIIPSQTPTTQENTVAKESLKDKFIRFYKQYPKRFIVISVALIAAIIAVIIIPIIVQSSHETREDKLTGNDKICYEVVCDAALTFKSPKSVRVISGYVNKTNDGKVTANLRLTATNSFGAETSGYYNITYDNNNKCSIIDLEKLMEECYGSTDSTLAMAYALAELQISQAKSSKYFNADKVNAALAEKWENY